MVSSGLCISVLTELSTPRKAGGSLRVVPIDDRRLGYAIGIVTRANKALTPSARLFVAALRQEVPRPSARLRGWGPARLD
jgi:DNA-binding transcriptional LysR family regulator